MANAIAASFISPFSSQAASSRRMKYLSQTIPDAVLLFARRDRYGETSNEAGEIIPHSKFNVPVYLLAAYNLICREKPRVVYCLKPNPYSLIPSLIYKFRFKAKLVVDLDEWDPATLADNGAHPLRVAVSRLLSVVAIRHADRIVVANKNLIRLLPQDKRDAAVYVPNGVDTERFTPRPKTPSETFTIMYVGSLHKPAQFRPLLEALPHLRANMEDFKLVFVGPGDVTALKKEYPSKHVEFRGAVEHNAVADILAEADVATAIFEHLPSLTYASNVKVFEYMAAQKPILASNVGELADVLAHGRAGWILDYQSPKKIAETLNIIRKNPQKAAEKARYARELACERFDWQRGAQKIKKLVDALGGRAW